MAFVDMTSWIPVDEAKAKIAELIENGTFTKAQIKKSSNLFANRKDKSEGYVCRVLIEAGIHPELEIKKEKKSTKKVVKAEAAVQVVEDKPIDNRRYVVTAEPVAEGEAIFLIDQGGKYWVEHQNVVKNIKTVISKVVDCEDDARWQWQEALRKYRNAS